MLPEILLDEAARRFALLGDASRLRILGVLQEGESSPGAIAEATRLSAPNVSQHLARLLAAGVISRRRERGTALYRISDPTLDGLCDLVCTGLRTRAEALAGA